MDQSLETTPSAPPFAEACERQETPTALPPGADKSRQTLRSRMIWFLVGAVFNYLFIATPFKYLKLHTHLSVAAIAACSVGLSTTFFFVWNYFINFRSDVRRRDALARYLVAVVVMWAVASATLACLKQFDFHFSLKLAGRFPVDLDIVATQFLIGGFKFLVYHRWVFPVSKHPAGEA